MSDIIEGIILKSCLKCGMDKHKSKFKKGGNVCKECAKTKKSQISNICEKMDYLNDMHEMTENEIEILLSRYRSCLMEAKRQGADGLLTNAFNNKLFELVGESCDALDIKPEPPRRIVRGDTITYNAFNFEVVKIKNTATRAHPNKPLNLRQVKSPEPPLTDEESDN